jgi:hypothetical protein
MESSTDTLQLLLCCQRVQIWTVDLGMSRIGSWWFLLLLSAVTGTDNSDDLKNFYFRLANFRTIVDVIGGSLVEIGTNTLPAEWIDIV